MFGSSSFGAPTGAAGGGFGTSAFSSSAGGFGQPQQQQGGFGAPAAGGAFGAPQANRGGFGGTGGGGLFGGGGAVGGGFGGQSTGGFGAPSTGGFGAPTAGGGFGTSFGQPTGGFGAPTGGGFGQPTGGGFGAPSNPAPFGSQTAGAGGMFGGGTATGGFGAGPTFGAQPQGNMFGAAPSTQPMFGATQTQTGGLFGNSVGQPGAFGGQTFQASTSSFGRPPQAMDSPELVNIDGDYYYSINARPENRGKSLEEIRFDDYRMGNRGPSQQQAGLQGPGSTFGTGAMGGTTGQGLFGGGGMQQQQQQQPFGATNTFGAPGQQQPLFGGTPGGASSSLFGQKPGGTSLFGGPQTGGLGNSGLMGQQQPQQGSGLFGAPAGGGGGLFGSQQPQQSAMGGGGLFGSPTPSNTFGQAPAAGGLFGQAGATQQQTSLFGGTPGGNQGTSLFGNVQQKPLGTGTGLFGGTPGGGTSLFGNNPGTSLFGSGGGASNANQAQGTSLFGVGGGGGGLFGGQSALGSPGQTGILGGGGGGLGMGLGATNSISGGGSGLFGGSQPGLFGGGMQQQQQQPQQSIFGTPANNSLMLGGMQQQQSQQQPMPPLPAFQAYDSSAMIESVKMVEDAWKSSSGNAEPQTPASSTAEQSKHDKANNYFITAPIRESSSPIMLQPRRSLGGTTGTSTSAPRTPKATSNSTIVAQTPASTIRLTTSTQTPSMRSVFASSASKLKTPLGSQRLIALATQGIEDSPVSAIQKEQEEEKSEELPVQSPPKPTFQFKPEEIPRIEASDAARPYSTIPSLEDLAKPDVDLRSVEDFTIRREGVGSIRWNQAVDVTGLVIGKDVIIEEGSIEVYPGQTVPKKTKLNCPATCEVLIGDLPEEVEKGDEQEFLKNFLEESSPGVRFESWNDETKVVVFDVEHF